MRIGILSDTHGKSKRLKHALATLKQQQADIVVHCGDIVKPDDIAQLGRFPGRAYLVAGNMDRHDLLVLSEAAQTVGVEFAEDFLTVALEKDQHLAATHGHREALLEELIHGQQYAYVCHGHTHRQRDERYGSTRVLNPGALYHPRGTEDKTFWLLDTERDAIEVLSV